MLLSTHGIVSSSFEEVIPFSNTKSLEFDGVSDRLSLGSDFVASSEFTISFWMRPQAFGVNGSQYVIGQWGVNPNNIKLDQAGQIHFKLGGTNKIFDESAQGGSNNLVLDTWQHIIFTRDSSNNIKCFRNGTSYGSSSGTLNSNTLTYNSIGRVITNTFGFEGGLDEIAFWNSDQTANINNIYSSLGAVDLSALNPTTWYRMGDNDTYPTISDNAGSNDATMQNMTSANIVSDVPTSFPNTKSIEFDGVSDYISLSSRTQNFTNFSLSFWCIVSNSNYKAIVGSSNTSNGGILYAIVQAGSTIRYRDSSTSWTSLTPNIADANWHHVLITYDNSSNTLKGYTDGSLTTTINPDYSSKSTQAHSFDRIGSYGTSAFFPNNIDELAVYDSVISIGDVWDGSGSPTDLTNTSPVHWWRMGDNDTYPTIYDNAGSNDGTMQGMTSANIVTDTP